MHGVPILMPKTPQACGCGCGGMTKGGRFLPGHDARFHAAQKKGRLGAAIAHATGAHGTAGKAPAGSGGYRRPVEEAEPPTKPVPEGEGERIESAAKAAPGMWVRAPKTKGSPHPAGSRSRVGGTPVEEGMAVRAMKSGKPVEGIVYSVDPFGNIGFIDNEGGQHIGYLGMTWVIDTDTKRKPNGPQRRTLDRIGRSVPAMLTGDKR